MNLELNLFVFIPEKINNNVGFSKPRCFFFQNKTFLLSFTFKPFVFY